jgi:CRISPR-associated protein Cas8b1/Cst1 subtype I-B
MEPREYKLYDYIDTYKTFDFTIKDLVAMDKELYIVNVRNSHVLNNRVCITYINPYSHLKYFINNYTNERES